MHTNYIIQDILVLMISLTLDIQYDGTHDILKV